MESETAVRKENLFETVRVLSEDIGPRNMRNYDNNMAAAEWIERSFRSYGCDVNVQEFKVTRTFPESLSGFASVVNYALHLKLSAYRASWPSAKENRDKVYKNIIAEVKGSSLPDEIIVIGAHYDSAPVANCRGADDNASGVAAVMELARIFADRKPVRTIRFVAFANEEPPFFQTSGMGSYIYAKSCRTRKEKITAMISMESIGYYSEDENSQRYPAILKHFYPGKGDFIALIGNRSSRRLVKYSENFFRKNVSIPCQSAALPQIVPGISWSDQWGFWKTENMALMVTDTAPFRNRNYHRNTDSIETLNFDKMAVVTAGVGRMIGGMGDSPVPPKD